MDLWIYFEKVCLVVCSQWSYIEWQNLNLLSQTLCNMSATSKASKGKRWNFELCDTSTTSKASKAVVKFWTTHWVWYPGKIIDWWRCSWWYPWDVGAVVGNVSDYVNYSTSDTISVWCRWKNVVWWNIVDHLHHCQGDYNIFLNLINLSWA